jgi:hypothetical protein
MNEYMVLENDFSDMMDPDRRDRNVSFRFQVSPEEEDEEQEDDDVQFDNPIRPNIVLDINPNYDLNHPTAIEVNPELIVEPMPVINLRPIAKVGQSRFQLLTFQKFRRVIELLELIYKRVDSRRVEENVDLVTNDPSTPTPLHRQPFQIERTPKLYVAYPTATLLKTIYEQFYYGCSNPPLPPMNSLTTIESNDRGLKTTLSRYKSIISELYRNGCDDNGRPIANLDLDWSYTSQMVKMHRAFPEFFKEITKLKTQIPKWIKERKEQGISKFIPAVNPTPLVPDEVNFGFE